VKQATRPVESRDEALIRLAAVAEERDVKIFTYPHTNEFYATSVSRPGALHRVTALSCTCAGFVRHQRCVHFAALLEHIGELPPIEPEPAPATTGIEIVCEVCTGDGYDGNLPCTACRGRGRADIIVAVIDIPYFDQYDLNQLRGVTCVACSGDGFSLVSTGGRLSDWDAAPCTRCRGAGLIPIPARACDLVAAA